MGTMLWLLWKQYRFELASVALAIGALAVAAVWITLRLDEIRPLPECLEYWMENGENGPGCEDVRPWLGRLEEEAGQITGLLVFIPMIGGILLGSVLVSREIEHRTAQLSWSLSASRRRWLAERVLPVAALLAVLLGALSIAAELLQGARDPSVDPRATLEGYGLRGLPLVSRGLAVFSGAVLLGALFGRQLPALILALAVSVAGAWAILGAFPYGAPTEWTASDGGGDLMEIPEGSRAVGYRLQSEDGTILTWDEAYAAVPTGLSDPEQWIYRNLTPVQEIVRAEHLLQIELRETSILLAGAGLALLGTFLVVDRRRPY